VKLGILGGGQLGRFLALAARELGVEPLVLDPKPDAPAGREARHLLCAFDDPSGLDELARCDAVTSEIESVPAGALRDLAARTALRPGPEAFETASDRVREKQLFRRLGIPTPRFRAVDSLDDLERGLAELGRPAVLKTRRLGYDGRGQALLRDGEDAAAAWRRLGGGDLILEAFVPFEREISVLGVRARDGAVRLWAPTENRHAGGILRTSRAAAAGLDPRLLARARQWARDLLEALDVVGVLALEMFVMKDGLLANEIAPRVHNSGHWTLEGAVTSQFENHVRAVLGLPLGETTLLGPCGLVNLIGRVPEPSSVLAVPGTRLHVYGKRPAPGRKLGHVSVRARSHRELEVRLEAACRAVGAAETSARAPRRRAVAAP